MHQVRRHLFLSSAGGKDPVKDILLWIQCFATLASALASTYPNKIPELMAYMATILKCHREFEGPASVIYDHAGRGIPGPQLVEDQSIPLQPVLLCHICRSESHAAEACPKATWQWLLLSSLINSLHVTCNHLSPAGHSINDATSKELCLDRSQRAICALIPCMLTGLGRVN